jgi:hypothetical protein
MKQADGRREGALKRLKEHIKEEHSEENKKRHLQEIKTLEDKLAGVSKE